MIGKPPPWYFPHEGAKALLQISDEVIDIYPIDSSILRHGGVRRDLFEPQLQAVPGHGLRHKLLRLGHAVLHSPTIHKAQEQSAI